MSQLEQLSLKSVKTSDLIQKLKAKFENVRRDNSYNSTSNINSNITSCVNTNNLQNENRLLKEQIEELKKELEVAAVEHRNQSFNSHNSSKRNQLLEVDLKSSRSSSKKKTQTKTKRNRHKNKTNYNSSDDTSENSYIEEISMNQNMNGNDDTQNNERNGGDKFMFSLICKIDPLHIMRINFYSSTQDKEQNKHQEKENENLEKENHYYQNHSHSSNSSHKQNHRRRKHSKNNDLSN